MMKYEISGTPMPVVILTLNRGETIHSESGAMSWMSDGLIMNTNAGGSVGKAPDAGLFQIVPGGADPVGQKHHPQSGFGIDGNAGAGEARMAEGARTHQIAQKIPGTAGQIES